MMKMLFRTSVIAAVSLTIWSGFALGQTNPNQSTSTGDERSVAEAALIAAAVKIMQENIKASGRESGEIDKLIRAISGVSIGDIQKYGICGGPNSEARKLAGSMCKPIN
ncbi:MULTISPECIES: hypothetical protein [Bradyrhizobium]|uniref:hypothetical protein n=1 Tax=Bradyrhizobium TaxID=374 RepID=UPI0013A57551|nr:hypothetical protein [Bradyrhizobium diazoefficiens]QJS40791.1 hypothetical protein DI395_45270 [Bradyrhizobium diazoefficiens]